MELHPATLWEAISDAVPARAAPSSRARSAGRGATSTTGPAGLAGALAALGVGAGAKVGQLLYNAPSSWRATSPR